MVAVVEEVRRAIAKLTGGAKRPVVDRVLRPRRPELLRLRSGGQTPNNPKLPLVIYRQAVELATSQDPAAVLEKLFASHHWNGSWRDGIYDFDHFHTGTHEVLGIARGRVAVQLGGTAGRSLSFKAGDVVVLPAGTGHRRLKASRDLLVVGAYPTGGRYDEPRPGEIGAAEARRSIAKVPRPRQDPVYGRDGPLPTLWKALLTPRQRQRVRARRVFRAAAH